MLVAIGIAWTIDGVSGQRLILQHQQQNLHLDDDAAPLGEVDEEAGGESVEYGCLFKDSLFFVQKHVTSLLFCPDLMGKQVGHLLLP